MHNLNLHSSIRSESTMPYHKDKQQAFQAAQLRGIKSKLLYLPGENHWVSTAQNGLVWQREFFKWLKETL